MTQQVSENATSSTEAEPVTGLRVLVVEDEVATLTDRLETRKVVDRAKGLLMSRQQMTEPEAFRWIQRTAMDRRTTMKAVAEAVVEGLAESKS